MAINTLMSSRTERATISCAETLLLCQLIEVHKSTRVDDMRDADAVLTPYIELNQFGNLSNAIDKRQGQREQHADEYMKRDLKKVVRLLILLDAHARNTRYGHHAAPHDRLSIEGDRRHDEQLYATK